MKARAKMISVLISMLFLLTACSFKEAIELRKMLTNTNVESCDYSNDSKTVHFIGMVHMGQEQFYKNVKEEIEKYKQEGYVLFYEWIDFEVADDLTLRKTKKIVGLIPSEEGYQTLVSKLDIDGVVAQDNSMFLGLVNKNDFKIDLEAIDVIWHYEQQYGEIELSEDELSSPIDYEITGAKPDEQAMSIILDVRNEYLARQVQDAGYNKILVLYGKAHKSGFFEELKKLDANWKLDN
ncbi:MAG: hypothetical protein N4A71_04345 [Carboxylicivirga sp.]|jgi:hypothetical protein|nr:hypothetical protein [Carboxylicivirga sp.]